MQTEIEQQQSEGRAALEAAYDRLESQPAEPAPEVTTTATPAPEPAEATTTESTGRVRNEKGQFVKADAVPTNTTKTKPPEVKATTATPAPEPAAVDVAPPEPAQEAPAAGAPEVYTDHKGRVIDYSKPPSSLPIAAREGWAQIPAPIRMALVKRDATMSEAVGEATRNKEYRERMDAQVRAYEPIARAAGMDPMRWMGSVAQTASALHIGAPAQKAQIVANLINTYGIDLESINAHLQGTAPPAGGQGAPAQVDIQAEIDRRIQQRMEQAETAQLTNRAKQAMDAVRAKSEFWNDLGGDAKIVPLAAALVSAGHYDDPEVALGAAYEMLAQRSQEVSAVLKQRQQAEAARAAQASTQRAKAAASSVRSSPTAAVQAQPESMREALERAYDDLASR